MVTTVCKYASCFGVQLASRVKGIHGVHDLTLTSHDWVRFFKHISEQGTLRNSTRQATLKLITQYNTIVVYSIFAYTHSITNKHKQGTIRYITR
jgi:hypothetical protein